ncbi:MAG: class I SAM-dependent methyltransferase, partial [Planctomycetota bacterium]
MPTSPTSSCSAEAEEGPQPGSLLRACDLCGAPPPARRPHWPEAPPGCASAGYATCGSCGLVFASPLPGGGDLAALHRSQYAGRNEPERLGRLDPDKAWKRQFSPGFQRWARNLLERMAALGPFSAPRLLEVGCACGGVLQAAGELGFPAVGVEISHAAAARGIEEKALDIRIGTLGELEFAPFSFQMVLLLDVLEHVALPRSLLDE